MKVKNFIKKVHEIKDKDDLDISGWEDLSIALMNLVSLEEHCFFSYVKTQDESFLDTLEIVRELRKKLLELIVKKDDDSEKWCMSKHLLASSMRLYESANRLLHENKKEQAKEMYKDAAELYGMFWKLNVGSKEKNKVKIKEQKIKDKKSIFSSVKKLLECCME